MALGTLRAISSNLAYMLNKAGHAGAWSYSKPQRNPYYHDSISSYLKDVHEHCRFFEEGYSGSSAMPLTYSTYLTLVGYQTSLCSLRLMSPSTTLCYEPSTAETY